MHTDLSITPWANQVRWGNWESRARGKDAAPEDLEGKELLVVKQQVIQ